MRDWHDHENLMTAMCPVCAWAMLRLLRATCAWMLMILSPSVSSEKHLDTQAGSNVNKVWFLCTVVRSSVLTERNRCKNSSNQPFCLGLDRLLKDSSNYCWFWKSLDQWAVYEGLSSRSDSFSCWSLTDLRSYVSQEPPIFAFCCGEREVLRGIISVSWDLRVSKLWKLVFWIVC